MAKYLLGFSYDPTVARRAAAVRVIGKGGSVGAAAARADAAPSTVRAWVRWFELRG